MNEENFTNSEIIQELLAHFNSKNKSDLARKLNTNRQNIKSYEKKKSLDMNNKIITCLMNEIGSRKEP